MLYMISMIIDIKCQTKIFWLKKGVQVCTITVLKYWQILFQTIWEHEESLVNAKDIPDTQKRSPKISYVGTTTKEQETY